MPRARQAGGTNLGRYLFAGESTASQIFLFLGEVWRENEQTSVRPGQSSSLLDLLGLSLACLRELSGLMLASGSCLK